MSQTNKIEMPVQSIPVSYDSSGEVMKKSILSTKSVILSSIKFD